MILFLGGMLLPPKRREIEEDSKVFVENAADALQRGFLSGIKANTAEELRLLNLPFIGSFPQAYKRSVYNGLERTSLVGLEAYEPSFVNVRFVRIASRLFAAFAGLRKMSQEPVAVVIYSAYVPFLCAAAVYKLLSRRSRLYLILPDFLENMGAMTRWRRVVLAFETRMFQMLIRHIDGFVLLTEAMAEKLRLDRNQYVVVEGMVDPVLVTSSGDRQSNSSGEHPTFLYTGALDARYGIRDLLEAFGSIASTHARLWICGSGEAAGEVQAAAALDSRISFFGRVSQDVARDLQRRADVLVNPRRPEGEFTKYSFPSKTMEYLAAGKPVIMHKLPGVPQEYLSYLEIPETADSKGLASCMEALAKTDSDTLRAKGAAGRNFVLSNKTPERQCAPFVAMIASGLAGAEKMKRA